MLKAMTPNEQLAANIETVQRLEADWKRQTAAWDEFNREATLRAALFGIAIERIFFEFGEVMVAPIREAIYRGH